MKTAFEFATQLKNSNKETKPSQRLSKKLIGVFDQNFKISEKEILEIKHISHFLYSIRTENGELLVSLVFNPKDVEIFIERKFIVATLKKSYQEIWYDLDFS